MNKFIKSMDLNIMYDLNTLDKNLDAPLSWLTSSSNSNFTHRVYGYLNQLYYYCYSCIALHKVDFLKLKFCMPKLGTDVHSDFCIRYMRILRRL